MRETIRHGAVLKCDARKCPEKFTSYSMVSIIRFQAKAAGWLRVPGWQVTDAEFPTTLHDVCPTHALEAIAARANRTQILKAAREKAKAERAVERAEKKKAKSAEKRKAKAQARQAAAEASP